MNRAGVNLGREDGQAIILLVVAMSLLLIGALGLAIDGGQMYAQRQMAQVAADAAAQSGIMSIFDGTNATSAHPFGTGSTPIAAHVCTTTDAITPCVYARDNGFGGTAADTVTVSFPATVSGVTLSSVTVPALAVSVQRTIPTWLIRFLGAASTSSITAKATAGLVGAVSPDCLYILDPSAQNAFFANNGSTVTVNGCAISVNSSSAQGAYITGGSTVTTTALDIVGNCKADNGSTCPTVVSGVPPIPDPFLSLPVPALGNCTAHPTQTRPASNTVLTPGTYCGGISVTNGVSNVVFSAGTYIINGGGISFNGGTTSSGSGVMFYLTGTNSTYASVTMDNGVNVTFSGPTTSPYQGVLFFQDRSITSSSNATVAGGATMKLTGSLYFPTTYVSFSNGSTAVAYSTAIVAKQVSFAGGANIQYDPTGLKTGLFSKAVALVQ